MDRRIGIGLAVMLALGAMGVARAYELNDVRLESSTGAGPHTALLVVDFWPYNEYADSFAFAVQFEAETITGRQLLDTVVAADQGFSYAAPDGFITDIWYIRDGTTYHTGYDWPASYWSYWVSTDFGQTWEYSMWGIDFRTLADGDSDGWLGQPGDDYTSEPVTPVWIVGDMNCDDHVDFGDINWFVMALSQPGVYLELQPTCRILNGDINDDGQLDFGDINPFVALLSQP